MSDHVALHVPFTQAQAQGQARAHDVRFGSLDCTLFQPLCARHGVQSYPALILFRGGRGPQHFMSQHSAHEIAEFVESSLNARVVEIASAGQFDELMAAPARTPLAESPAGSSDPDGDGLVDRFLVLTYGAGSWCGPCVRMKSELARASRRLPAEITAGACCVGSAV